MSAVTEATSPHVLRSRERSVEAMVRICKEMVTFWDTWRSEVG